MKILRTQKVAIVVFVAVLALMGGYILRNPSRVLSSISLAQKDKPKCNCYFPDSKQYGVKSKNEGCQISDCIMPEKTPTGEEAGLKNCQMQKSEAEK